MQDSIKYFIYNEVTAVFLQRIKKLAFHILNHEMKLETKNKRVFVHQIYYPLNFVAFEHSSKHGYWSSEFYEIGINKNLAYQANEETLKNIIRHELCHFYAYIVHGLDIHPHGEEFRKICQLFNYGPEVYLSSANINDLNTQSTSDQKHDRLIEKIKKLLTLASSDNLHESELATAKANQLMLEHNLTYLENSDQDDTYVYRVLEHTRKSSKHLAIYEILKTFYVYPVFNQGRGKFYLEVIGNKASCEVAEYVAQFLNLELDRLWIKTQKVHPHLKGKSAKNSFFSGVAKGYVSKIEEIKYQNLAEIDNQKFSLQNMENALENKVSTVYPKLGRTSFSQARQCVESSSLGLNVGKQLNINKGLKNNSQVLFLN